MPATRRTLFAVAAASIVLATATRGETPLLDTLTIVAPASRGGGWDQVARAMEHVLQTAGLVTRVEVKNSPGAGGAIALGQFIAAQKGDAHTLLVGGLTMVRAARASGATVALDQTTPVARLVGEYEVIAVPAGSDVRTLDDLVQALRVNPGSVTWAGGSGGGTDQLLINEVARAIGVEPVRMTYVPYSGGAEVEKALLHHSVGVGVSGLAEFSDTIADGRLVPLAISSDRRLPGIDIPTLKEQGVDRSLVNWRGVFAPPDVSAEDKATLTQLVDRMVRTDAWHRELERYHWTDLYLPDNAFAQFVFEEQARAAIAPDPRGTTSADRPSAVWTSGMLLLRNRNRLAAVIAVTLTVALGLLMFQRASAARRERELARQLELAREAAQRKGEQTEDLLRGLSDQIDRQLDKWGLTAAEKEIAMLMLKGLRHKEIAAIRNTSERTVRQQALTVYRKAGVEGRTELAAFFFEDLLPPLDTSSPSEQPSRKSA